MASAETPRPCAATGEVCGYDAIKSVPGIASLARFEALVEAIPDPAAKDAAAQDLGDVSYRLFTDKEQSQVSNCVDCIMRKLCIKYEHVGPSEEHPHGEFIERHK